MKKYYTLRWKRTDGGMADAYVMSNGETLSLQECPSEVAKQFTKAQATKVVGEYFSQGYTMEATEHYGSQCRTVIL